MPTLSPKRQITLPKALCDRLQVSPGDVLEILEHKGRMTILKKMKGNSAGVLKHLKVDRRFSEEASLHDVLVSKLSKVETKRRAA